MRMETAHVIGKDEYRGGGTRPEDEQQRRAAPHLAPNRVGGPSGQDANVRLSVGQSKLVCSFALRLEAACCVLRATADEALQVYKLDDAVAQGRRPRSI